MFLSFTNSQHKIFIILKCNIVFLFLTQDYAKITALNIWL